MNVQTKEETRQFAKALAKALRPGDVLCLDGPMGAGKTTMVQWICETLGVEDAVTSPTFSLVHQYASPKGTVYHLDLYRLDDPEEVEALDYEELFYPEDAYTLIEWGQQVAAYLPPDCLRLQIEKRGGQARSLTLLENHERAAKRASSLRRFFMEERAKGRTSDANSRD